MITFKARRMSLIVLLPSSRREEVVDACVELNAPNSSKETDFRGVSGGGSMPRRAEWKMFGLRLNADAGGSTIWDVARLDW